MRHEVGFMEVNFASLLANFCADLSQIGPLAVAVIGAAAPASVNLVNTRKWIGYLPTYDTNGHPSASGAGLLGIPCMVGCHSEQLNPLCSDYTNGFRLPGIFVTDDGSYDGSPHTDNNGNTQDAGRHLHIVAD